MTVGLSANTQAILLLTAPLIAGRVNASAELLSPGEYKRLARHLRELKREPADLTSQGADDVLQACQPVVDARRLSQLLGRGFLLSQALERWQARAIWVVSRADEAYPPRFKTLLRDDAPPVIYGCGDMGLMSRGGLAVVGSRNVDDALVAYAEQVGRLAAQAGRPLISGAARGIDEAAMRGALDAGGNACGVVADSLEKAAMNRTNRSMIMDERLTLITPYDPSAGFSVGHAMQRNKLVYALADAALIVNSDVNKGGTWSGAIEQLSRYKWINLYVRATGETSPGLSALRKNGALAWPNPTDAEQLDALLSRKVSDAGPPAQADLQFHDSVVDAKPETNETEASLPAAPPPPAVRAGRVAERSHDPSPSETLFTAVTEQLCRLLATPREASEVAALLDVTSTQARMWLKRLEAQGMIHVLKKPTRYVISEQGTLLG